MMFSNPRPRPRPGGGVLGGGGIIPGPITDLLVSAPLASRSIEDKINSWHMDSMIADTSIGALYCGEIDMKTGSQGFAVLDSTGAFDRWVPMPTQIAGLVRDDHSAVSGVLNDNGQLVAAQDGHNDTDYILVYRSTDATPDNLSASTQLDCADDVTYTQMGKLDNGTIYLAYRYGTTNWGLFTNANDGDPASWVAQPAIITHSHQCYIRAVAAGNNIRILAWQHPTNALAPTIRGNVYYREFTPGDASAALTSLDQIFEGSGGGTDSIRVLSVNDDLTAWAYLDFTVGTHTGQQYRLATLTGDPTLEAGWTHEDLTTTDGSFYEASHYVGGVEMANGDSNTLYVARYDAGAGEYTLEHWTRPDALTAWTETVIVTDGVHIVRPLTPRGVDWDVVTAQRLSTFTSFFDDGGSNIVNADTLVLSSADSFTAVDLSTTVVAVAGTLGASMFADTPDVSVLTVPLPETVQAGDVVTVAAIWSTQAALPTVTVGASTLAATSAVTSGGSSRYGGKFSGVVAAGGDTGVTLTWAGDTGYQAVIAVQTRGTHEGAAAGVSVTGTAISTAGMASGDLLVGALLASSQSNSEAFTPDVLVGTGLLGSTTEISFVASTSDVSGGVTIADNADHEIGVALSVASA